MTDLMTAARQYARAQGVATEARAVLYVAIRAAAAGGMPETRIAEAAHVARMTVRKALGKR